MFDHRLCSLLPLFWILGCGAPGEPPPDSEALETVDVSERPDARVDPSRDPVEKPTETVEMAGVLPTNFPADLPPPSGSSLVDHDPGVVVFMVPEPPGLVRERYRRRLEGAGWSPTGADSWTRDGITIELSFSPRGPGTRIELRYGTG